MVGLDEYQQEACRTSSGGTTQNEREVLMARALGLAGEAGEVCDLIKKHVAHGHPLVQEEVIEELGDVLIQIVFHARIEEEAGNFSFEDVARDINEKLVRRHPHVFGDGKLNTSAEVIVKWEEIKATEKKHGPVSTGVFKDLPPRLPALMFAEAVWKQIEKKELPAEGVVDKAQVRALGEQLDATMLGKLLFELTAAARAKGLDPEAALRLHATQVMRDVEKSIQRRGA